MPQLVSMWLRAGTGCKADASRRLCGGQVQAARPQAVLQALRCSAERREPNGSRQGLPRWWRAHLVSYDDVAGLEAYVVVAYRGVPSSDDTGVTGVKTHAGSWYGAVGPGGGPLGMASTT